MNYYTYIFIVNGNTVHGGITTDPERREGEHQQKWPTGHMQIVGGPMSEKDAREWERRNGYS